MECGKLWWSLTLGAPVCFNTITTASLNCFLRSLYLKVKFKNARNSSPTIARKSQDPRRNLSGRLPHASPLSQPTNASILNRNTP
ncbi:hypothetical protein Pdw03_7121 [Penicillium digitatum]|uniref:Uncharacterized protein n=1 Tax=Penicillium digitatum TaxID=36651 RepID=A0A7T7BKJ6_PENDI|nr:hypothetical protein Pdw03_7121 [Penicillium digitatum]